MSCIDPWFLAHKMFCVCVGRCMLAGMHIIAALVLVAGSLLNLRRRLLVLLKCIMCSHGVAGMVSL